MWTSIQSWKNSFIKVYPVRGYHPFFMDKHHRPCYPFKWPLSMWHEDWSFDNLLHDDEEVVAKLLAVVLVDAQAIISEFTVWKF